MRVLRLSNSFAALAATMIGGFICDFTRLSAFTLGGVSVFFTAAFGYAINDYYDVAADRVTKPSRPIPSGALSRRTVLAIALLCAALALVTAVFLPLLPSLLVMVAVLLVWFYSLRVKRTGVAGNVLVAFLSASTLLFGGLCAGDARKAVFPTLLAFLANLPREILKDVQDLEGDVMMGGQTLARLSGRRAAVRVASVFMLVLVAASIAPYALREYNRAYLIIVLLIDVVVALMAFSLWYSASQRKVTVSVRLMKSAMYLGLVAILLGSL
ncbi:MAG: geranylgeranylglycerol-phosphate geranylgeranyltransferase [Candidatus Eisenbacteria bacterium]|nr:geranylgeranylglycerol-phosphate geranylgeranyltransferase [Candidatus Eisenbacteria bacterium]